MSKKGGYHTYEEKDVAQRTYPEYDTFFNFLLNIIVNPSRENMTIDKIGSNFSWE